ncbi:MAG: radical SAM protein [Bacteroidales bacterium]|nr:radical SAM protein [Bacteroidales bacterium]
MERRVFGPVPSRRLGQSLGINNIPYKICTYSCSYCQVGKAIKMQVNRQEFYKPKELADEVKSLLKDIQKNEQLPDYITIVPDGEPTLDIYLGKLIDELKNFKIPIAVITNSSLIHLPDVQEDLLKADFVSVKVDAVSFETWKKMDRPHKKLNLDDIKQGIQSFANQFGGKLVTETMLVSGINDSPVELENTARFIETFNPNTAYISIPTRPPAFKGVFPADENAVTAAYNIFRQHIAKVELLTGYEGNAFSSSGNFREDILSITAVHPMREDAVMELMHKTNDGKELLDNLLGENLLEKSGYGGHYYYLRKFKK